MTYHHHVRSEISPLLPATADRIVDVGCSAGVTLAWLKQRYPSAYTIGLEANIALKLDILQNADEARIVDVTKEIPDLGKPDLMLFLDVLEHLPDPMRVLLQLTSQLAPSGTIIVSLPNVAHLSIAIPLILRGEFSYRDAGILDRTHLKFFVRESAVALVRDAGFRVDRGLMGGIDGVKSRLADAITCHCMRSRLAKQFILRGIRDDKKASTPVKWDLARYPRYDLPRK